MSQENVEIVHSIFAAWRRGDFRSVEWAHPEITFVVADGPAPGSWSGVAAMAEAWREALSAFEHLRTEADEYRALDDERVFVRMHLSGRGKTSGLEVGDIQMKGANLFHLRDGKVTRLVLYWDRQHAHPDVGLSESAMSQANVEIVRRGFEAANRQDVEALIEVIDPEVEWHSALLMSLEGEAAVYRGHEGIREFFRDLDELFDRLHAEYPEIRDLGDRVVGIGRIHMRGKGSGAETESPIGTVVDLKNGKVTQVRTYLDPKEALEAAGLSE